MVKVDTKPGLYQKYIIERTDGSSAEGCKHERCDYFVLDLVHDEHAVAALLAYADSCESQSPQLANELRIRAGALSLSKYT